MPRILRPTLLLVLVTTLLAGCTTQPRNDGPRGPSKAEQRDNAREAQRELSREVQQLKE